MTPWKSGEVDIIAFRSAVGWKTTLSFRGDAQHRTMVRNCAPENLEIPGLVLRTIPE
jgi:hypothetical protein